MDAETIKVLILEKLFNDTIPEIANLNKLFNPNQNNWTFSNNNDAEGGNVITCLAFSIYLDNFGNFELCNVSILQYIRERGHLAMLAGFQDNNNGVELINSNEEFNNKDLAIKKLCDNMNLQSIIQLGHSAKKELERINSADGMHIGTIRNILDIPKNLDITNLETRKVLLEKIK